MVGLFTIPPQRSGPAVLLAITRKRMYSLNASETSSVLDVLGGLGGSSRSDVLAVEVGEEAGVRASKGARATVSVRLAVVAEGSLACGVVAGRCEDLSTLR